MGHRRLSPCRRCRERHHACFSATVDHDGECLACQRAGVKCEIQRRSQKGAVRYHNTTAALRAISLRVGAVIDELRDFEPAAPRRDGSPEIDDLVERLTSICFAADGLGQPPNGSITHDACEVMAPGKTLVDNDMDTGGFVLQSSNTEPSVQNLLAALPPWSRVERILLDWPQQWQSRMDALFLPSWPRHIERLYASHFTPEPHPHTIAELLAFLALNEATIAVILSRKPSERAALAIHIEEAERLVEKAFVALDLEGSGSESPTFTSIRALYLIAAVYIGSWVDHSKLRKGLAVLPLALSLVYQLGLNRADEDFTTELPSAAYERKALVYAIVRMLWVNNPLVAKRTPYSPRTILFSFPECLPRNYAPPYMKYQNWTPSETAFLSLRIRSHAACLRNELQELISRGKDCDYDLLRSLGERISREEDELFPKTWQPFEEPVSQVMTLPTLEDPLERIDRFLALPLYMNLHLTIHRCFLTLGSTSNEAEMAYHRSKLLLASRKQWTAVNEVTVIVGGFLSSWCAVWDIAICSALLLSPTHIRCLSVPEVRHCQAVVNYCIGRYRACGFPDVYRNLVRLISFVLCRLNPATTCASLDDIALPQEKRAKTADGTGPLGLPLSQLPMPTAEDPLALDFLFEAPVHSLLGPFDDDWELPHLQPGRKTPQNGVLRTSFPSSPNSELSRVSSPDLKFVVPSQLLSRQCVQ